jgi:hypothetical protein
MRTALAAPPLADAVSVTEPAALTGEVDIDQKPPLAPAGMVSVVEATAELFELVSATAMPPAGAAVVSATETFTMPPPVMEPGETLRD